MSAAARPPTAASADRGAAPAGHDYLAVLVFGCMIRSFRELFQERQNLLGFEFAADPEQFHEGESIGALEKQERLNNVMIKHFS